MVSRDNAFVFSTTGSGGRGARGGGIGNLLAEDPSTATRSGRIVCPPVRMSSPEEILTSVQVRSKIGISYNVDVIQRNRVITHPSLTKIAV